MASNFETGGIERKPLFKAKRKKTQRPGGVIHSAVRNRRNEIAQSLAQEECSRFLEDEAQTLPIGRPSEAYYTLENEDYFDVINFPYSIKKPSKVKKNYSRDNATSGKFTGVILTPREHLVVPDYGKVEQILGNALISQLSLMSTGNFDHFKDKTDFDFFNASWQDPFFLKTYNLIQSRVKEIKEDTIFNREIRGAIFETMSYTYLSSLPVVEGRKIPIFGSAVVEVMQALFPHSELINNGIGQGMRGKYVPDGLFVTIFDNKPKIDGIIECSLGKWVNKPTAKDQEYGMYKLLQTLDPVVFDPKCYIVLPKLDIVDELPNQSLIDLVSIRTPFYQQDFISGFVGSVYSEFRYEGGKTIEELRQELHRENG